MALDNVGLHIDGVLYVRVDDPYKASYGVEDPEYAVTQLAQTTMRSEIGKHFLVYFVFLVSFICFSIIRFFLCSISCFIHVLCVLNYKFILHANVVQIIIVFIILLSLNHFLLCCICLYFNMFLQVN